MSMVWTAEKLYVIVREPKVGKFSGGCDAFNPTNIFVDENPILNKFKQIIRGVPLMLVFHRKPFH